LALLLGWSFLLRRSFLLRQRDRLWLETGVGLFLAIPVFRVVGLAGVTIIGSCRLLFLRCRRHRRSLSCLGFGYWPSGSQTFHAGVDDDDLLNAVFFLGQ